MKRWAALGAAVMWPWIARASPVLLDNFNEGKTENALGGGTGAWYDPDDPSIFCHVEYDEKVYFGSAGKSLRLDYNIESRRENIVIPSNNSVSVPTVKGNQAFNGYFSLLPPKDLSSQKFLCLWVKGDGEKGFSRSFKIELKDGSVSYTPGYRLSGVGERWQKFVIPLRAFSDVKDWTKVKEFVVVFSADAVNRLQGSYNIDDVYFAETAEQNFSVPFDAYTVGRADPALEIDGRVMKDWSPKGWSHISGGEYVESGVRSGKSDAGSRWAATWDDQWLYFAVEVRDNQRVNNEPARTCAQGDAVEILLDPDGTEFDWGDPSVLHLALAPTSADGNPAVWATFQKRSPTDQEVRVRWNSRRDTVEVAVAWSFLKLTPGVNRDLGAAVAYHDVDTKDSTKECRMAWGLGNLGKTRTRIGRMVLK